MNEHAAVFADLCEYTRLTEQLGDEAGAKISLELFGIASGVARRHGGRVVKTLGDGVHLHFDGSADAVPASLELMALIRSSGLPCARVGVNAGPMVEANGDYYGRAVNVAARIASHAAPGDVLVGETAAAATGNVRFERVGPLQLRGVAREVTVYRAFAA